MLVETLSTVYKKALSTDATDSSFPSRIPKIALPSGNGVIATGWGGGCSQNAVKVLPYATAGDDDTFSVRVIAWDVLGNDPNTWLWVPTILAELACTASTMVGVAGRLITSSQRFVDTITLVTGNDDVSISLISPTGNVGASAVIDMQGAQFVEFTFDPTAAGTTAMNTLYKFL